MGKVNCHLPYSDDLIGLIIDLLYNKSCLCTLIIIINDISCWSLFDPNSMPSRPDLYGRINCSFTYTLLTQAQ